MLEKVNKNQPQGLLHSFLYDPNIYISVVMKIRKKSEVSINDVKEAIEMAYTQNETTMSKVVLDNGEVYFEKMPATGCKVFVDNRNVIDIINENEKNTFRINEGELIRSFIIDSAEDINVLIMAHNIVGDGNALVLLSKDILSNLSGESVKYKTINNHGEEFISSYLNCSLVKKIGLKSVNRKWKKVGKNFNWEDYYILHRRFWQNKKTYMKAAIIKGQEFSEIKDECRDLGISVNSYIIAKQLEIIPKFSRIGMAVSYRGRNKSLANKVMDMKIKYKYNTDNSFESNAKELNKVIHNGLHGNYNRYEEHKGKLNLEPTLLAGALMEKHTSYRNEVAKKVSDALGYSKDTKVQLGIQSLDRLNIRREYDSFELKEFMFLAAPTTKTENVISSAVFDNSISVCCITVK